MAQFDVHRNGNPASAAEFPLLLDVQSGLHDGLRTRLVVPLSPAEPMAGRIISGLMPVLTIDGAEFAMLTPQAAGIPPACSASTLPISLPAARRSLPRWTCC